MKRSIVAPASCSCLTCASSRLITLMFQPVSWLARRTFCPPRPIACARLSSATATSMVVVSSSTTIDSTSAGAIALITSCAGLSSHSTMSTRSPSSSFDTACTREPRMPTQAPIGSMRPSLVFTAIFARRPGSRAAARISITCSLISGTSIRTARSASRGRYGSSRAADHATRVDGTQHRTNPVADTKCFTSDQMIA
jgi:hypothetical protein